MNTIKLSAVLTAALLTGALSATAFAAETLTTTTGSITFRKAIDVTNAEGAGGITGTMAAYLLTRAGAQVALLEALPIQETVEAIDELRELGAKRIELRPMMLVAGDHAQNDMAGDDADSWKSHLTAAGFDVHCTVEGLGALEDVQKLYVEHLKAELK